MTLSEIHARDFPGTLFIGHLDLNYATPASPHTRMTGYVSRLCQAVNDMILAVFNTIHCWCELDIFRMIWCQTAYFWRLNALLWSQIMDNL